MIDSIKEYALLNKIPIMRDDTIKELIDCAKCSNVTNILEIGTAIGYSGSLMLINNTQAQLTTIEIDYDRAEIARKNFESLSLSNRVNLIIGDVREVVPCLVERYDLILLDGPKGHYNELLPYIMNSLTDRGVLFADNVLYHGLVEGDINVSHKHRTIVNNMRKFLADINNMKKISCTIKKIDDGLLIARKEL